MSRRRWLVAALVAAAVGGCASDDGTALPAASPPIAPAGDGGGTPTVTSPPAGAPSPVVTPPGGYGPLEVDLSGTGTRTGTVTGPEGERTFQLDLPQALEPGAPLLVALHGYTQGSAGLESYTGIAEAATARGIVTVRPDGYEDSWNGGRSCCPPATREGVDDVGFLAAVADGLTAALELDPDRTWAVGFSNGGFLALRTACEAAGVFEAVVSHAGTMDLPCAPSRPVSVLLSHGDRDPIVPFADGRGPVSPQAAGRGAHDVLAAWVALDGCGEPEARPSLADAELLAAPCDDGTAVGLAVWAGVGHTWPPDLNQLLLDWLEDDGERRR